MCGLKSYSVAYATPVANQPSLTYRAPTVDIEIISANAADTMGVLHDAQVTVTLVNYSSITFTKNF